MNPNQSLGSGLGGSSFSFGAAPAFGASGATPAPAVATTTQSTGFSFGFGTPSAAPAPASAPNPTATSAQPSINLYSSSAAPNFGTNLTFGKPTASVAAVTTTTATASALPTFGAITTTTMPQSVTSSAAGAPAGLTSTTTTTQSTTVNPVNQLTFAQIEELINKYTLELEEQEKVFINQATQVNTWDNLLNNNSIKIIDLNNAVEKVKIDQKVLEDELKFIEAQHMELEECITPLKNELDKVPHVDMEKAQTFLLAESLDTQLRQMSEDLKEVIEHLNEVNKLQNPNDPIVQIGRILNAHMNSLQWIESTTSQINTKLDEINKMYDTLRRDTERSLRLTYCD